jgi:hypothetical protein
MMRFRDLPLRRKLLLLTLTSSAVALVLASSGFSPGTSCAHARRSVRTPTHRPASSPTTAARRSRSATIETAGETLAILRLRPRVVMSCLYDSGQRLFATYYRDPGSACPAQPPITTAFTWSTLEVAQPVLAGPDRIGSLYIRRELTDVGDRLRVGMATVAGLLAVSFIAAFLIAARIQRSIAAPLSSWPIPPGPFPPAATIPCARMRCRAMKWAP